MFLLALFWALLALPSQAAVPQEQDVSAPAENAGPPLRDTELLDMLQAKSAFTQQAIADEVRTRGIAFRLTEAERKTLRKAGAGPVVMDAVEKAYERLRATTSAEEHAIAAEVLSETPKQASAPPPLDAAAALQLIGQVRENALAYTDRLPNFLCLQVTRRMIDFDRKGFWGNMDTVITKVAFNDHHENYQVIMVNNKSVDKKMESLGGAVSTGEFGSMLRELFVADTQADFRMVGPATLRDRPVYAYDYRVLKAHSKWQIVWEPGRAGMQSIVPGYHGRVIVDAETHQVLRMWVVADDIPPDFPIRSAASTLDYDWAKIAGQPYLLPAKAVMEMKDSMAWTRNEITFRGYRRFSGDTAIKFDDVDLSDLTGPQKPGETGQQPQASQPPASKK